METSYLDPASIADIALRSFVLLLMTAVMSIILRRRSAAVRHGIWTAGLAGCLAMPIVVALLPRWSVPLLPHALSNSTHTESRVTDVTRNRRTVTFAQVIEDNDRGGDWSSTISPPVDTLQYLRHTEPAGAFRTTSPLHAAAIKGLSPGLAASVIWGLGFCIVLARLIQQVFAAERTLRQARDVDDTEWCEQRDVSAQRLGLRTKVALKQHFETITPMVAGLFRPAIVLPFDAHTWSVERRMPVLLHELAHVKRWDVLTQTMGFLACALNWFNPICWYGLSQMRRLREMACDDLVLMSGQRATDYADVLLDIARAYRHPGFSTTVGMAHRSSVENRILAILDRARSRVSLTRQTFRAFLLSAAALVLVVGSLRLQSRAGQPVAPDQFAGRSSTTGEPAPEGAEQKAASEDHQIRQMEVQITDEAGKPLEGARLYISVWHVEGYPGPKDPEQYFTDSRGIIQLKLPRRLHILRMWPSKPGYVPLFVNFARGKHQEGKLIPDKYAFQLRRGHQLSGRIVDNNGQPICDAEVQVEVDITEPAWGEHPDAMISSALTSPFFSSPAPVTDSDGQWSITNAPAHPENGKKDFVFRLKVIHPDFASDTFWGEHQQRQGITTEDLRSGKAILTLTSGAAISGEVAGPDGQPVTRGWVVWSDEPYFGDGVFETEIKPDGSFRTPPLHPREYPITIVAPGFAAQRRVVSAGSDSANLRFKLQSGKRLEIRFVDISGKPIPRAGVAMANSTDRDTWNRSNALHNHRHPNVPDYGIPVESDENGVFVWDWAPEEPVKFSVGARGFAGQEVSLVAGATPHVITLADARLVSGKVTDAMTSEPVRSFQTMPVIVFRTDFYHTCTPGMKAGLDGHYELPLTGSGDPDVRYRVRFEADGYRSVVSEESFGPLDGRATLNYSLQPAPSRKGRVVDAEGRPVEKATVLEASPTDVPYTFRGEPELQDARPVFSDPQGNFQFRATTEPVRVRVYHDLGFAEKAIAPEEKELGEMKLEPWATISGRLLQAGQPVPNQSVSFSPLEQHGLTEARFQDSWYAVTNTDGHFEFERIPPVRGSIRASLGPWKESSLTSSESIPVQLSPGEHRELTLGGDGVVIKGRVAASGRNNDELSKQWSINYLVSRDTRVTFPIDGIKLSFNPSEPLSPAWLRQPDFHSWLNTRRNYFVKLSSDGRLQVHGVEPGEYDLVIQLYEQPAGCLIETIGEKIVPVIVSTEHATSGQIDLGDIDVPCRIGPRVGSSMRAFQFTDSSGRVRYIDDMQGRHVLLHVWATWCAPCLESMPKLRATIDRHSDAQLVVVGLNVDEDSTMAKAVAKQQRLVWAQNYPGPHSDIIKQLAISSVPAYYLIGPDGKLAGSANQWEEMEKILSTAAFVEN